MALLLFSSSSIYSVAASIRSARHFSIPVIFSLHSAASSFHGQIDPFICSLYFFQFFFVLFPFCCTIPFRGQMCVTAVYILEAHMYDIIRINNHYLKRWSFPQAGRFCFGYVQTETNDPLSLLGGSWAVMGCARMTRTYTSTSLSYANTFFLHFTYTTRSPLAAPTVQESPYDWVALGSTGPLVSQMTTGMRSTSQKTCVVWCARSRPNILGNHVQMVTGSGAGPRRGRVGTTRARQARAVAVGMFRPWFGPSPPLIATGLGWLSFRSDCLRFVAISASGSVPASVAMHWWLHLARHYTPNSQ